MEDKNKKLIRINDCGPYFLKGGGNIYDTTIFKQFFESDDSRVLGWAENVYDKLENANILPAFIRKRIMRIFVHYGLPWRKCLPS